MIPVKIGGVYILTRRSIARMLATITAALMMFYASATAQAKDMVRRIHDATIALVSLDRQMIGRLAYVVVPDFMYLEYRALYLELRPFRDFHGRVPPIVRAPVVSGAAVAGRPPYPAARRDASPHHAAVTSAAAPVVVARSRGRRGSGLKGSRTERMVEQLAEFKAWLRDNPVNERIAARTVGARASIYWRLHEKTFAKDATRTGEKRGFSSPKTLASAYRNSKA